MIPAECAKCHSKPGFADFLGVDRSESGQVDRPAEIGTTVVCYVCHVRAAVRLDSAVSECGVRLVDLGRSAGCVVCHQGRTCSDTVDQAIAEASPVDDDEPSALLGSVDSHANSAATVFGTQVRGAYEYQGKRYSGPFSRMGEGFLCLQCHDPHSLEVDVGTCESCHMGTWESPQQIRAHGIDYDGDNDVAEGVASEVDTIRQALLRAIQAYASAQAGTPIVYDGEAYPYYFVDSDSNGEVDSAEASFGNSYNAWTPRLLKAAYNYNYAIKDPGAYAHNLDYVLQILYDSLEDIGGDTDRMSRPAAR